MINRFKIVVTERKTEGLANEVRASHSRSGIALFVRNNDVLEMQKFVTGMTAEILNDLENNNVIDETLD